MDRAPIQNDDDHRAAVEEIRALWNAPAGSPEKDRLDVLATLVDDYEGKRWPGGCFKIGLLKEKIAGTIPDFSEPMAEEDLSPWEGRPSAST